MVILLIWKYQKDFYPMGWFNHDSVLFGVKGPFINGYSVSLLSLSQNNYRNRMQSFNLIERFYDVGTQTECEIYYMMTNKIKLRNAML